MRLVVVIILGLLLSSPARGVDCQTDAASTRARIKVATARIAHEQDIGLNDVAYEEAAALAELILASADLARVSNCPKIADEFYRQVLVIFTGTVYAAYRQRAVVGIDDVRKSLP
jgi:hypothetical protein